MRMPVLCLSAALLLATGMAEPPPVQATERAVAYPVPSRGPITMLSYNVEGLPWPLTHGRGEAAAAIATLLRDRHAAGDGPQVVALQEAFGADQKAIGARAGYRYAAFGPSAATPGAPPTTPSEIAFLAAASFWHGETESPREDSGLAIFSDYPIVWARRMAFPRFACAGYDCLANKGVLAVALRVPNMRRPLIVVDTHLNARAASGVDDARSLAAYRRQVAALRGFVAAVDAQGSPLLLAGDFNVGNDDNRKAYLSTALLHGDALSIAAAESACGDGCRAMAPTPTAVHAKTIVAYRGTIAPVGESAVFGALPDGDRLSDHIGIVRAFAVSA